MAGNEDEHGWAFRELVAPEFTTCKAKHRQMGPDVSRFGFRHRAWDLEVSRHEKKHLGELAGTIESDRVPKLVRLSCEIERMYQ